MKPEDFGLDKLAYTRRETAAKLNIGLSLIDKMIADGTLSSVKLGDKQTSRRLILATSIADVLSGKVSRQQKAGTA